MAEFKHGTTVTTQHRRDMEAYQAYKCKDRVAWILMRNSMKTDLMLHFKNHYKAMTVEDTMKIPFGGASTTKLRQLTLKFDA